MICIDARRENKGHLTACHLPSMSLWLMASMDTDLVRGRVIGGQLFRRGRYRLDFWSVRNKTESNTVHDNMKKDTKPGRNNVEQNIRHNTGKRNNELKREVEQMISRMLCSQFVLIQWEGSKDAWGKWCLLIHTYSHTEKFPSSSRSYLYTNKYISPLMWIELKMFLLISLSCMCDLTGSCSLLCSSISSCSSVRDTREPLSSLSWRGIHEGSRIRGPCVLGPLSSTWPPVRPSRL